MKITTASWIKFAAQDYKAKNVLSNIEDLEKVFAFHCQQSIEKLLKALLNENDILPPKSHDIIRLYTLLPVSIKEKFKDLMPLMEELNSIYIDSRYPADFALLPNYTLSKEDIEKINNATDKLYNNILSFLKK